MSQSKGDIRRGEERSQLELNLSRKREERGGGRKQGERARKEEGERGRVIKRKSFQQQELK